MEIRISLDYSSIQLQQVIIIIHYSLLLILILLFFFFNFFIIIRINEYSLYCSKGSDINATLLRDIREAAENSTEVFFDMLPCLYKEVCRGGAT